MESMLNHHTKYWSVVVVTSLLLLFVWRWRESGSIRDFFLRPARVKPNPAGFVGRWKLDEASLPSVERRTGKRPADSYLLERAVLK